MSFLEGVRNFLVGRPDTGVALDPEAMGKARQATQMSQSIRRDLQRKNDADSFLDDVLKELRQ